jgi:hypothetical protein
VFLCVLLYFSVIYVISAGHWRLRKPSRSPIRYRCPFPLFAFPLSALQLSLTRLDPP